MRRGIAVRARAVGAQKSLARTFMVCAVLAGAVPAGIAKPAAAGAPGGAAPAARATIDALAWLAGHWRSPAVEEVWLAPRGGLMLAMTREIRGGPAATAADGTAQGTARPLRVSFEYLRIEQRADGSLVLLASPGGRPPTAFALAEVGVQRVRFANAGHDFPQEILYWRDGETLHAQVSGLVNGERRAIDYAWTRAPDAGATPNPPASGSAPAPASRAGPTSPPP